LRRLEADLDITGVVDTSSRTSPGSTQRTATLMRTRRPLARRCSPTTRTLRPSMKQSTGVTHASSFLLLPPRHLPRQFRRRPGRRRVAG
jgi:hypothetical protein